MRKKLITGAAVLALLMNAPQVSAEDDIVIFGGEFDEEATPAPKKTEKPKPAKELPPPKPEVVAPRNEPPIQPIEEDEPEVIVPQNEPPIQQIEEDEPEVVAPRNEPPIQPIEEDEPEIITPRNEPQIQPIEEDEPEIITPRNEPPIQPIEEDKPEVVAPRNPAPPVEFDRPFEYPTNISGGQEQINEPIIIIPPTHEPRPALEERHELRTPPPRNPAPQKSLKMLNPRFIKLAADDTYIYYLDKTSVQWKKIPYLTNEYMADVWVRMIERNPAPLDDDMTNYGAENFNAEVELAREQGYQYPPEDLKVLSQQSYVLEHYYLRPKTNQIQFLCELEVFGRPQNAINERAYDYKNWENLVPGSVESIIYSATLKIIGKSKATERGHMTFIDMLEEYGRISLR